MKTIALISLAAAGRLLGRGCSPVVALVALGLSIAASSAAIAEDPRGLESVDLRAMARRSLLGVPVATAAPESIDLSAMRSRPAPVVTEAPETVSLAAMAQRAPAAGTKPAPAGTKPVRVETTAAAELRAACETCQCQNCRAAVAAQKPAPTHSGTWPAGMRFWSPTRQRYEDRPEPGQAYPGARVFPIAATSPKPLPAIATASADANGLQCVNGVCRVKRSR